VADRIGEKLTPWASGEMDFHHINTGRGNCTYCILPDGTTLLIDAGQLEVEPSVDGIARRTDVVPNDSRAPWEWATRYIQNVTEHRDPEFDYVWLTHFHSDHLGQVIESSPVSANGAYRLSGLTGVCDQIPFSTIMDRAWPDYDYPLSAADCRLADRSYGREGFANSRLAEENYLAFLDWHSRERGVSVERFAPGRSDQITLQRDAEGHSEFRVRNIVCNGEVWTGEGTKTKQLFPPVSEIEGELPNENTCSCASVIENGAFRYFAGGDITGIVELGRPDWFDVESPVADVVGPVDVAVLNHHGHRDTHNEHYVAAIRPRVWIGHSWSADHPGQGVFRRMTSTYLYPGERDLFATNMMDANRAVIGPALGQAYKSTRGHVVVRVAPGGESYRVVIVDDTAETLKVNDVFAYTVAG
jgi:beta-lactamase superfamily II metal-dependent hydrolase